MVSYQEIAPVMLQGCSCQFCLVNHKPCEILIEEAKKGELPLPYGRGFLGGKVKNQKLWVIF
jgi:hypothetical protein